MICCPQAQALLQALATAMEQQPLQHLISSDSGVLKLLQKLNKQVLHAFTSKVTRGCLHGRQGLVEAC